MVHEGGHALAGTLNLKLGASNLRSEALSESQAYTFEAAWNRTTYEFVGKWPIRYSKEDLYVEWVNNIVSFYEAAIKKPISLDTTHAIGNILPWARAKEKGMLKLGQQLTAKDAYALFLDLVTTPKDDADAERFVDGLLAQINPDLGFIREHAISRLTPNLPKEQEMQIHSGIDLLTP